MNEGIYQFINAPVSKNLSKKPKGKKTGVYLHLLDDVDNIGKCKVVLVRQKANGFRFHRDQTVYVPLHQLTVPDYYPAYHRKPSRWIEAVEKSRKGSGLVKEVEACLKVFKEDPKNFVLATIGSKKITSIHKIKIGQVLKSKKADAIKIVRKSNYSIIYKKFGGSDKLLNNKEFMDLVEKEDYRLIGINLSKVKFQLGLLLTPFIGLIGVMMILSLIEKRVMKGRL